MNKVLLLCILTVLYAFYQCFLGAYYNSKFDASNKLFYNNYDSAIKYIDANPALSKHYHKLMKQEILKEEVILDKMRESILVTVSASK